MTEGAWAMNYEEALRQSLNDDRIQLYKKSDVAAPMIKTSPAGVPVARSFALAVEAAEMASVYPPKERQRILEQIRLVLQEFFVHLGMKKAQFGYDPVRALDRLEPFIDQISDEEFHQSIIQAITRTRDRHLVFYGRTPNGVFAVLPFDIERCWINGEEAYVVSKIEDGFTPQHLAVGARVTHWNGTPIARQIRINANLFDAGNEPALIARAVEFLTRRPLYRFAWPSEEWVRLNFVLNGVVHEEQFNWTGFDVGAVPISSAIGQNVIGFGGDHELSQQQQTRRAQFATGSFDSPPARDGASGSDGTPVFIGTKPNFQFGIVTTQHGTHGIIRLYHFRANGVGDIASDFLDALLQLPSSGLIIDIRGNSGGYIAAGERLLQLFTPKRITPTRFQFRVSPGTRKLIDASSYFDQWQPSMQEAHQTGEGFTQGYPIEGSDDDANQIGQKYFGPVVVVSDGLALSTADMFTAGFIDHDIGRVICIDKNMAAAGGNNWNFNVLRLFVPEFALDNGYADDLEAGNITEPFRQEFNRNGTSLSVNAQVSASSPEFGGRVWTISDGILAHEIRELTWMSSDLQVYPDSSSSRLQSIPDDLYFGFTVRRCVRTGRNEGRLLEDLGIRPHVVYKPTLRDVLEKNQDLYARATYELKEMSAVS